MWQLFYLLSLSLSLATPQVGDFLTFDQFRGKPYNISYDSRSFYINNQRTILLGGAIHYPRMSPGDWPIILKKAKEDGLNHIQSYVFWNLHEPHYDFSGKHVYDFSGRANLTKFLQDVSDAGLWINLRIGPYVCAEWDFGGLPVWLMQIPGIVFRDDNGPWEQEMETFVRTIAKVIEPFLARNGGPIILSQIENEYQGSQTYVDWCGQLTIDLALDIPWIMCNGMSANSTINSCNGNDCASTFAESHLRDHPNQPLVWTENEGWFQEWDIPSDDGWDDRTPADMAYTIARWFAVGAAHHCYYMWYGGNHLAHWAGSGVPNFYADGVNYHADGLPNEPKKSHLMKLHQIIAQNNRALMGDDVQFGKDIPLEILNSDGQWITVFEGSLQEQPCNSSPNQIWYFSGSGNNTTGTLQTSTDKSCAFGTSFATPILTESCSQSDTTQQWLYLNNQFISVSENQCMDINGAGAGPLVGLWTCTGNSNQNWVWNSTTGLIISNYNRNCLTLHNTSTVSAYTYQGSNVDDVVIFLQNTNNYSVQTRFQGTDYYLPAMSVSILDYEGIELYNTAKVDQEVPSQRVYQTVFDNKTLTWSAWQEPLPPTDNWVSASSPLEQLNFTQDDTEYMFYQTNIKFPTSGTNNLNFTSRYANAWSVFIGETMIAQTCNDSHYQGQLNYSINLGQSVTGSQTVTMLSLSLGIDNAINNQQPGTSQEKKGITGGIWLDNVELTNGTWLHRKGLTGETKQVYTTSGSQKVTWNPVSSSNEKSPLMWFKTTFPRPSVSTGGSLLFDATGLNRGHWYLNDIDMGRYWTIIRGSRPVQQYYYIPPDYLQDTNLLVVVEELGATQLSAVRIASSTVVIPQ